MLSYLKKTTLFYYVDRGIAPYNNILARAYYTGMVIAQFFPEVFNLKSNQSFTYVCMHKSLQVVVYRIAGIFRGYTTTCSDLRMCL